MSHSNSSSPTVLHLSNVSLGGPSKSHPEISSQAVFDSQYATNRWSLQCSSFFALATLIPHIYTCSWGHHSCPSPLWTPYCLSSWWTQGSVLKNCSLWSPQGTATRPASILWMAEDTTLRDSDPSWTLLFGHLPSCQRLRREFFPFSCPEPHRSSLKNLFMQMDTQELFAQLACQRCSERV